MGKILERNGSLLSILYLNMRQFSQIQVQIKMLKHHSKAELKHCNIPLLVLSTNGSDSMGLTLSGPWLNSCRTLIILVVKSHTFQCRADL